MVGWLCRWCGVWGILLSLTVEALTVDALTVDALTVDALTVEATPGARHLRIDGPPGRGLLAVTLWYPASETQADPQPVQRGRFFQGSLARLDSPLAKGRYPLVLLAHGGLRSAPQSGNWVAAALSQQGYLVAQVHGPEATPSPRQSVDEVWRRPDDLSAVLAALQADPVIQPHLQPRQVAVLGFFRGATSALLMAGARLNGVSYQTMCAAAEVTPDCRWWAANGVNLEQANRSQVEGDYHNPQVSTVLAVMPELSAQFTPASLAAVTVPVGLISLTQGPHWLDGQQLAANLPVVEGRRVNGANPYLAFNRCSALGKNLAEQDGEGAICSETGREVFQQQLLDTILAYLMAFLHR